MEAVGIDEFRRVLVALEDRIMSFDGESDSSDVSDEYEALFRVKQMTSWVRDVHGFTMDVLYDHLEVLVRAYRDVNVADGDHATLEDYVNRYDAIVSVLDSLRD